MSDANDLRAENARLRARVAELEARVAELEEIVSELGMALWWGCPKATAKSEEYRMPISSHEGDACRELARLGKLEKHPDREWYRRKENPCPKTET